MKKIISLFQRNYDTDRLVRDEVTPGAEWVLAGEGRPTRKWDGTACMVRDGKLFKRYDRKVNKPRPEGWEPCEQKLDEKTGHWPGWVPVGDGPEDKWHRSAFEDCVLIDGTYELCGPKVQGNPEGFACHSLIRHGRKPLDINPITFKDVRDYLSITDIEGIVWHHPDGRMVKIKAKDFGIKRGSR
ncbi:MAG: hypothetical protein KAJ19_25470 [Gammaproteobacteria bacterium]|nr:hypothetical protein [Gammaproteobacteria bacterium]